MDLDEVIDIVKDFNNLPHLAIGPQTRHYGFRKKLESWIKDIEDKQLVSASTHIDLIDTCNRNFVAVPFILRKRSTPKYKHEDSYWAMLNHYAQFNFSSQPKELILAQARWLDWNIKYE